MVRQESPVTEAERQQALSSDEPIRLRRMFEEHGAFVCRSLRMLGVPEGDLDDALQEVFLVVFQRMHDYEERGRVRAWLYSICTRVVWTRRRVVRRRREELGVEIPEAATAPTQHDRVVDQEALALGHKLLQGLPVEQRDVFWLYEVEELPMSEIARSLNCPLQTAYSRLHKARERILAAVQLTAAKDPDHV
jgi:RNA polymerase sigma-70 factor (ECF subfamily)